MHVSLGSYYKCILYMQLITGHAGTCTSIDIVKVYGYLSPTPTPHSQRFIYMFLQRSIRLHALVKSNSHWILIKIPLIDY